MGPGPAARVSGKVAINSTWTVSIPAICLAPGQSEKFGVNFGNPELAQSLVMVPVDRVTVTADLHYQGLYGKEYRYYEESQHNPDTQPLEPLPPHSIGKLQNTAQCRKEPTSQLPLIFDCQGVHRNERIAQFKAMTALTEPVP